MTAAVLFLDHEWRPLRVEGWKRAISDLWLKKIEVIEYSHDKTIRGVSGDFPLPAVVRVLRKFKRDKMRVKFSRLNIYARDRFVCQYCRGRFATEDLTFDHVMPRSRGGKTTWENIVTCCLDCNKTKANKTPEEAGVTLARIPKKPAYLPAVMVSMNSSNIPPEWQAYWQGVLSP